MSRIIRFDMKRLIFIFTLIFIFFLNYDIVNKETVYAKLSGCFDIQEYENVDGGEYVRVCGDIDDVVRCLGVKIHNRFEVAGRVVVEGFVKDFSNTVVIAGDRINIQLACSDGVVVIGSPLIKKSF